MLALKDRGEWEEEMILETRNTVDGELVDKINQIITEHGISLSQFEKWKTNFESQAPFIDEQREKFKSLEIDFFEN